MRPTSSSAASSATTPVGLWGLVMMIRLVRGRHRRRDAIGIEREAVRVNAIEPHDARAEQPRRAEQRIVAGPLDEHLVARLEKRRAHQEVRAGRALRGGDLFGAARRTARAIASSSGS